MAETTLCIILLLGFWVIIYDELIDSVRCFQQFHHEVKERRAAHNIRIARLKTELKRIKERCSM